MWTCRTPDYAGARHTSTFSPKPGRITRRCCVGSPFSNPANLRVGLMSIAAFRPGRRPKNPECASKGESDSGDWGAKDIIAAKELPGSRMAEAFLTRLDRACAGNRSLVCVGLDPDPERMPVSGVFEFNQAIIEATADLVCAYKPNAAFYEALGIAGLTALERTVQYVHDAAPHVIVIGDAKRGDVGPSGQAYARAMFQVWDFDAVTVNAWGGLDSISPFLTDETRGVFIWCRGSNQGSSDLQDLPVDSPEGPGPLYQRLAETARQWNKGGNIGLVVGATAPSQLEAVRKICPDMPLLIPGVGAQGGDLERAIRGGIDQRGRRAIVSSSRGIIYASAGADYAEAARNEAQSLRRSINLALSDEGKGWPQT